MGEVWQATDLVIGRTVAIKILKDEYLGDPGFLERFRAEARHAALVNHEGIANVFDYGEEDGSAFLVMELVPGEALSTILERERVLSTDKVLDIVAQTAGRAARRARRRPGAPRHQAGQPADHPGWPGQDHRLRDRPDRRPGAAHRDRPGHGHRAVPLAGAGERQIRPRRPPTSTRSASSPTKALAGRRPFTGESQVAIAMAQINETPPDLPVTVSEPVRNLVFACIAKNPADRPASAAHLARAAQALRRGDVAAAAASVPAILAGITPTGATMLMPGAGSDQATTVLPTSVPGTRAEAAAAAAAEKTKRSPWTWPLIALIALLAVVLIGTLIALFSQGTKAPATTSPAHTTVHSTAPSPTPSATPKPSPTPTSSTVAVNENEFMGLTSSVARDKLANLGLSANVETGSAAVDPGKVDTVYFVNPTGPVPKGTEITLKVYGPVITPPAPTTAPTVAPATIAANGSVTMTWTAASCPSGQALAGYRAIVTGNGATVTSANPTAAGVLTATVDAGPTGPGTFTVSYSYFCGQVESGASPLSTPVTVTP